MRLATFPLIVALVAPTTVAAQQPTMNVVVLGHIGHGKTTLSAAITKLQAERGLATHVPFGEIKARQERGRGITVFAAHMRYRTENRTYTLLDFPTHPNAVKQLIVGEDQPDVAILVVSAADGPQRQTLEQLSLARTVNVPYVVVFLNKVDRVDDPELLDGMESRVRGLLSEHGYPGEDVPVIRGSALEALKSGEPASEETRCIDELLGALDEYVPEPRSDLDGPFLMPIEDVFSITGRGTVATGRIARGRVRVGDEIEIVGLGAGRTTAVDAVEMFRELTDEAVAEDNVGLLLRGTERGELESGMVLAEPGSIAPHTKFESHIYMLSADEGGRHTPFYSGYRPQVLFRTADVTGEVALPAGVEMAMPGDDLTPTITLVDPMAIEEGLRFAIREGGRTVGVGVVTRILE
jgi:elongation factor Tu